MDRFGYESAEMKALFEKQQPIDEANTKRLVEIFETYGWPGKGIGGENGPSTAFFILQHADIAYQKRYLPLARKAATDGELAGDLLAMLEDRILMSEGKKQIYGTQLRPNGKGGVEFYPIEDEEHVDQRRRRVGLPPIAEYAKQWGLVYGAK